MDRSVPNHQRIHVLEDLRALRNSWRSEGLKVVFTNGVFDLLHRGHVTYLEQAAALGDALVVGVNDDAGVRRLGKGENRPIVPEEDRAMVIAALRSVDAVILFGEDTPLNLVLALEPDVLVKGGDYDADSTDPADPRFIVGSTEVKAMGGTVATIGLVPGRSTTAIAGKLKG
ncbi:MAG: adenylyltransferase/cytidyltransferase family protein [Flavobacteriales bacterium]|nr:adenylyltransferase/cytidyltransferase family protein [Flavobacteriales bacterium]